MDDTISDSNGTNSSPFLCVEPFESKAALRKKVLYEKHNFDQFRALKSDIISKLNKIREIHAKEFAKIRNDYQNLPPLSSYLENKTQQEELRELSKQNVELKEKLEAAIKKKETISEEISNLEKENEIKRYALREAKIRYRNMWGMDVSLEHSTKYILTYVVKFSTAENHPLKITIDRNDNSVLDFEATSLLTEDEVKDIKKELGGSRFELPRLLLKLRSLTLDKVKEL